VLNSYKKLNRKTGFFLMGMVLSFMKSFYGYNLTDRDVEMFLNLQ